MRLTLTSVQVVKFIALFVPDVWLALFPSTVRSARARLLLLDALRTDTLAAATRLRTVTPMPWPWRTRLLTSAIDAAMLNVPSLSTTLPPPAGRAATGSVGSTRHWRAVAAPCCIGRHRISPARPTPRQPPHDPGTCCAEP